MVAEPAEAQVQKQTLLIGCLNHRPVSQGISLGQIPCHASTGSATARGAVKLHVGLEHEGLLPAFVAITDGKAHDLSAARALQLPSGSIVVIDRGYNDYA